MNKVDLFCRKHWEHWAHLESRWYERESDRGKDLQRCRHNIKFVNLTKKKRETNLDLACMVSLKSEPTHVPNYIPLPPFRFPKCSALTFVLMQPICKNVFISHSKQQKLLFAQKKHHINISYILFHHHSVNIGITTWIYGNAKKFEFHN